MTLQTKGLKEDEEFFTAADIAACMNKGTRGYFTNDNGYNNNHFAIIYFTHPFSDYSGA